MVVCFASQHLQISMDLVLDDGDLLMEIFLRLPVKSLIRFKSVCKKWCSIISSDHLCHQHTLRRPKLQPSLILQIRMQLQNHMQLFYLNPTIKGEKVMTPYSVAVPEHKILDACNGLLLLESIHHKSSRFEYYGPTHPENRFYVYNPTTRRSREISLTNSDKYRYVAEINLAFDPSKSPYYKIVCIRSTKDSFKESYTYQIDVYDSESHTWNVRVGPLKYPRMSYGVHWNNAIYWSSDEGYCYFDIGRNEMKTLSFPQAPCAFTYSFPVLQEWNGHLYHFEILVADRVECESVVVWELGGDNQSEWLFKYHHPLTSTGGRYVTSIVKIMGESDGDGTCSLLIHRDEKMKSYSFLDKRYVDLIDLTSQPFYQPDRGFNVTGFKFGEILALV